jgi:hypothetical protein
MFALHHIAIVLICHSPFRAITLSPKWAIPKAESTNLLNPSGA